jgi:hypothetical protein
MGASVRTTLGRGETPDSSRKQMVGPWACAPCEDRPDLVAPLGDRGFVAWPSPTHRVLRAPAESLAEAAVMGGRGHDAPLYA